MLERRAMEGFVSPESHSNVRKQLMDLQVSRPQALSMTSGHQARQRELATAFTQVDTCQLMASKGEQQVAWLDLKSCIKHES